MNHNKIFFVLLLILCSHLYSQESLSPKELSVGDAVDLAIRNNLVLAQERLSLATKKRVKDTTWNYFIPKVSLSGTLSRPNEAPQGINIPGYIVQEVEHTWNVSFGFSASLSLTASMIYGIRQTVIDYETGVINLSMAERKITKEIKKIFYNILLMRENILLMEQSIAAMGDRYEQAVNNYNNGLVSEYVMLSTQVAYENAKPGLQDLTIAFETLLLSFKQLIGIDRDESIRLAGTIETGIVTLQKDELMNLVDGKSEIQVQKKMVDMLKNMKDLQQSALYPVFTMMFTFDPTFRNDPFADPWFDNIDDDWTQYSGRLAFVLTVPIDGFIPNSKTQVELAGSNDAIKKAELAVIQVRQAAELEIETIYMKLQKSQKALEALKLNVELAERAYALAEEAYNAGSKELLEVQNSELERNKARIEVLKEKYNYIMGLLDLEYSLNISLMEDKS
ncbi:MAG: TolC family protein [Spirochaetales bacterium]|nr:TolC family protein [Spirochaetales bacterium]